jgi:spermidine synthase
VSKATPRLLTIVSPVRQLRYTLRLLEPPDSCPESLWERVFCSAYDKPFIVDSPSQRRLQFDLYAVQSAMHPAHPDRLILAYTRKMMAFLLFNRAPARILLLGLGGGSLAKFCYRRLPGSAVTAVEVNPDVIALREEFRIPADDDRFRVLCADAADYLAQLARPKDVILADACDGEGIAPGLDALEFYQNAYRRLSSRGVFVANICGARGACLAHVEKIRTVFGEDLMTLQARADGNVIVFALKERRHLLNWERLASDAVGLQRKFGLDFPNYLRRIALDRKLRRWRHAFA